MQDVEFLVPDGDGGFDRVEDDVREADARTELRGLLGGRLSTTVAAGFLMLGAVVSILAPFEYLTIQRLGSRTTTLDGWGRVASDVDALTVVGAHGPRFGVPLVIGGLACGVLACWVAITAWRGVDGSSAFVRIGTVVGLLAGGVMIGSTVAAWLYADALLDTAAITSPAFGPDLAARPRFETGRFCLFGLAAAVSAVLGTLALATRTAAAAQAAAAVQPTMPAQPAAQAGPATGDELLP